MKKLILQLTALALVLILSGSFACQKKTSSSGNSSGDSGGSGGGGLCG